MDGDVRVWFYTQVHRYEICKRDMSPFADDLHLVIYNCEYPDTTVIKSNQVLSYNRHVRRRPYATIQPLSYTPVHHTNHHLRCFFLSAFTARALFDSRVSLPSPSPATLDAILGVFVDSGFLGTALDAGFGPGFAGVDIVTGLVGGFGRTAFGIIFAAGLEGVELTIGFGAGFLAGGIGSVLV